MKQVLQAIKSLFRKIEASIDKKLSALKKEIDGKHNKLEAMVSSTNRELENTNDRLAEKAPSENANFSGKLSLNSNATGINSVALGYGCTANGMDSVALGRMTVTKGTGSISAGYACTTEKQAAMATGYYTQAKGEASFAEGYECNAYAIGSHASGYRTEAKGEYQFVHGKCNVLDKESKYAHIVGNGYKKPGYADTKSNAYTLDWNGNGWFAGDVYVGSASGIDKDNSSKKLATEDYVNEMCDYGGAISWNDLTDKPFGEVIETSWALVTRKTQYINDNLKITIDFTATVGKNYKMQVVSADGVTVLASHIAPCTAAPMMLGILHYRIGDSLDPVFGDGGTGNISWSFSAIMSNVNNVVFFELYEEHETITVLDEMYIPDTIARTEDVVLTINGQSPDENGNVEVKAGSPAPTEEETLQLLMDMDIVQPLSDTNGALYVDTNNKVYVL